MSAIDGGDFFLAEFFAEADDGEIDEVNVVIGEAGGELGDALPIFGVERDGEDEAEFDELRDFGGLAQVPGSFGEAAFEG